MEHGDARIELLAAMSELHATMTVAKKQLESVEQKQWQFFKLATPEDNASSPPKRNASAEAERAAFQKRRRINSEDTMILDAGATPSKVPVAEEVTLTLKAESQPWWLLSLRRGMKKVCCMLHSHSCIHPFTHSVTHSLILTDLDDHCSMWTLSRRSVLCVLSIDHCIYDNRNCWTFSSSIWGWLWEWLEMYIYIYIL